MGGEGIQVGIPVYADGEGSGLVSRFRWMVRGPGWDPGLGGMMRGSGLVSRFRWLVSMVRGSRLVSRFRWVVMGSGLVSWFRGDDEGVWVGIPV